jgi:hypothetical protein
MVSYKLRNIDLSDPHLAFEIMERLIAESAVKSSGLCFCAFSNDLEAISSVANGRFDTISLFCWSGVETTSQLLRDLPKVRAAHLKSGPLALRFSHYWDLPFYDWDELPPQKMVWSLDEFCPRNTTADLASEPKQSIVDQLGDKVLTALGEESQVRTSTTAMGNSVRHSYIFIANLSSTTDLFRLIKRELGFEETDGAFCFDGEVSWVQQALARGNYHTKSYPPGLFPLSSSGFAFAVAPEGLTHSVLNCSMDGAVDLLCRGWASRSEVPLFGLRRSFLPWRGDRGVPCPRTMGNYCEIVYKEDRLEVNIGVEKFGDEDPPVRPVVRNLQKVAQAYNGEFKRENW